MNFNLLDINRYTVPIDKILCHCTLNIHLFDLTNKKITLSIHESKKKELKKGRKYVVEYLKAHGSKDLLSLKEKFIF